MVKKYDLGKSSDMRKFSRDLDRDIKEQAKNQCCLKNMKSSVLIVRKKFQFQQESHYVQVVEKKSI